MAIGKRVSMMSLSAVSMPLQSFSAKAEAVFPFRLRHYEWRSRSSYPKRKRPGFLRVALACWNAVLLWMNF
jgi:hypothetical protein